MKYGLILLGGGLGKRMGTKLPKPFVDLMGKPLIQHSLDVFKRLNTLSEIVITCPSCYRSLFRGGELFALPGPRRQDSVANALRLISSDIDYVLVHDGARPLVTLDDIKKLITHGTGQGASALAGPVRNSLKKVRFSPEGLTICHSLNRDEIREVYTPQMLEVKMFKKAMHFVQESGISVTDDLAVAETLGIHAKLVETASFNLKITYPKDIKLAEAYLQSLRQCQEAPV